MPLQRWKLTIEYDGTNYCGWQLQPDGMPTIQQKIERALFLFCGQNIRITGAGRTDSGVHAMGQIAHFDLDYGDREIRGFDLAKALNAHLRGETISIVRCDKVNDDFHARFSAKNKLYRYRIVSRSAPPVMDAHFVWHYKYSLDIEAMRKAASYLIGHHDFTSFRDTNCQSKSPVKTLKRLDIYEENYDNFGGKHIYFELEAQSFLHHQCRNIVGTLVDIGRNKMPPEQIKDILAAKDRAAAGMTAPAQGLCFVRIDY